MIFNLGVNGPATYDLSNSDATIVAISKIRRRIGDLPNGATNQGILPQGENFSDDEIALFLSDEGDHVQRGAAACLEAAANAWASWSSKVSSGSVSEDYTRTAVTLREQAQVLRNQFGYGNDDAEEISAGFAVRVATS